MRFYEVLQGLYKSCRSLTLRCQTISTHHQTAPTMVSNDLVLCGDEVHGEFFSEPSSSPRGLGAAEQLPVSVAASSSAGGGGVE